MTILQFHNKNQYVLVESDKIRFFKSYDSIVAKLENKRLTLGYNWNYGATTRKHLYMFIKEFAPSIWQLIEEEAKSAKSYNMAILELIAKKKIKYDGVMV